MLSGGRIEHHVKGNLSNPYATFYFIGYCAEGTLGYELIHGKKHVRLGGKELDVIAQIETTDVLSGHAGQNELREFVLNQHKKGMLKKVFLVHGEESKMNTFKGVLAEDGVLNVEMPQKNQRFELA